MELGLCVCGSMCVQSTVTSLARLIHFLIFLHSGKDYKITGTAISYCNDHSACNLSSFNWRANQTHLCMEIITYTAIFFFINLSRFHFCIHISLQMHLHAFCLSLLHMTHSLYAAHM